MGGVLFSSRFSFSDDSYIHFVSNSLISNDNLQQVPRLSRENLRTYHTKEDDNDNNKNKFHMVIYHFLSNHFETSNDDHSGSYYPTELSRSSL